MSEIVVIGSSNVDYLGKAFNKIIEKDSNVGKVTISSGGVGRNICENLLRLKEDVTFITALGNDKQGERLESELLALNCKIIKPQTMKSTASYLAISDNTGDMVLGLCDTSIIDEIDIELLEYYDEIISSCKILMVDANISLESIGYLLNKYSDKVKIIVDGISTTKVLKFKDYLSKIYLLKVNKYEYDTIYPFIKDNNQPKYLIKTSGKKNIECFNFDLLKVDYIDVPKVDKIINTTGAGDALLSGIISYLTHGKEMIPSIKFGIERASLTLQTSDSVYKD